MLINQRKIIIGFRYFWLLAAVIIIFYIIQQNLVIAREIAYQIDLSQNISRDIEGLYPIHRVQWRNSEQLLSVIAEPLYLQAYLPDEFSKLIVSGRINLAGQVGKIGLKSIAGGWAWQDIRDGNFSVDFDLAQAVIERNRLQLIFSFPNLKDADSVGFYNLNLKLQR